LRARIVLACAQGGSNLAVAARLGVNRGTVTRWRARFLAGRLDGLSDEPVRPFPGLGGCLVAAAITMISAMPGSIWFFMTRLLSYGRQLPAGLRCCVAPHCPAR
jgi:Homeodomain-like domain